MNPCAQKSIKEKRRSRQEASTKTKRPTGAYCECVCVTTAMLPLILAKSPHKEKYALAQWRRKQLTLQQPDPRLLLHSNNGRADGQSDNTNRKATTDRQFFIISSD